MADEFSLIGLEPLLAKLDSVKQEIKYKGGRFGLRKAANIVAAAAKNNAKGIDDPKSAADISENIAVRWSPRRFKSSGDLMFRVGVMGGAGGRATAESLDGLPGKDTRHWRHVEFGTTNAKAQPFMRRALSENVGAATAEFLKQTEKAIDRAIKKAEKAS
jgi:HK97 gp10 family phage protein